MKAWKHHTGQLFDLQTVPGPLPEGYNPEDWTLTDVTEAEIATLMKICHYTHTPRGIAGLFETSTNVLTHNLEDFV